MLSKSPNKHAVRREIKTSIGMILQADTSLSKEIQYHPNERVFSVAKDNINKELEILGWRFKTFLPIVKPVDYFINQNSRSHLSFQQSTYQGNLPQKITFSPTKQFQGGKVRECSGEMKGVGDVDITIKMEEIRCRLSEIDLLPLSQIVYLMKEMMIGYDALIDIFGIFGPTESMVALSGSQWKVWINQNFYENKVSPLNPATGERDFIYRLLMLSEKHCQSTNMTKSFFAEMKEFTYSNQCSFISMIEKIKQFCKSNKIFQVNKVTLPQDKLEKVFNPQSPSFLNVSSNITESLNSGRKPAPRCKIEKKMSFQPGINATQQLNHTTIMKKSNFAGPIKPNNMSQIVGNTGILQQSKSHKVINSSLFYYPPNSLSNISSPIATISSNYKNFKDHSDYWNDSSRQHNKSSSNFQKPKSNFLQNKTDFKPFRSPDVIPQQPSPKKHLDKTSPVFANLSKSRHELKILVNQKSSKETQKDFLGGPIKTRQRKYSEQLFKPKSVEALAKGVRKFCGSNIYEVDPQIKAKGVNVIKKNNLNIKVSPQKEKSSAGPGSTTPNHSSNSTNEMQNSTDNHRGTSYHYLKLNDLSDNKRNNQSSYYGMGQPQKKKEIKNMTISYQFKNRNEDNQRSPPKNQQESGNNWAKKISGLFSDDASIKHLKGSVKFKTVEEERFEKEYLKDVKLDLLEKYGRQARMSMVQEDDDFGGTTKNPYKSMQLIEEVMDEGKSYMEKEEDHIQHSQEEHIEVRGRNKTVQIFRAPQEQNHKVVKERQCYSFECDSQQNSEEQFNFEPEHYIINRR